MPPPAVTGSRVFHSRCTSVSGNLVKTSYGPVRSSWVRLGKSRRPICRVRGWRANCRVRWRFRRFRSGPQSGSHRHVSSPCSPNPACRFPAPGSPVGSCASHTDRRGDSGMQGVGSPTSSAAAARLPLCIPVTYPASRRACSRLDDIEPVPSDSFAYACDASGIIALNAGSRHRHSRQLSSFRHRSTPEAPVG